MEKYLLNKEKDRISGLSNELKNYLHATNNTNFQKIENKFYNIMKNTKDGSIEDILNTFIDSLIEEMQPLLDENLTPGLQFGIKNDYFDIKAFGGNYNGQKNKEITENTMFSFDSISKLLTSSIVMQEVNNKNISLDTPINEYNNDFALNSSFESILKFTALIRTNKRIDNLSKEETIDILKKCKENLEEKAQYKNFYEYNDIGYMILRLSIHDFLDKLNNLLNLIDEQNLTYLNLENNNNITGGKLEEEHLTPDRKGREIPFPGHTGIYGNITGLLNLFYKLLYTNDILNEDSREQLLKQPYQDPRVYNKDGSQIIRNNKAYYTAKIAGLYRKPKGIHDDGYSKMTSCDMSELTTNTAKTSTGTCGAWTVTDSIDKFGTYVGGILTNPYSFVEKGIYPNDRNNIPNTELQVNRNGVILGYQGKLNKYKEIITEYALILNLITEYIKLNDNKILQTTTPKTLTKKI